MSLGNRSLPSSRFQIDATTRGFSPKEETNRRRAFSFFLFDSRWRMVSSAMRCTAAAVILMVVSMAGSVLKHGTVSYRTDRSIDCELPRYECSKVRKHRVVWILEILKSERVVLCRFCTAGYMVRFGPKEFQTRCGFLDIQRMVPFKTADCEH